MEVYDTPPPNSATTAGQAAGVKRMKAAAPPQQLPQGAIRNIPGAFREAVGMEEREGADTVRRVLTKPQGAERLIRPAIAAPILAGAGMAAGAGAAAAGAPAWLAAVAPAAARIGTSGVISKGLGENNWETAIDMIGATVGEGAAALVGKVAAPIAKAAKELDAIRQRIGKGPDGPVNLLLLRTFVERIKKAPDELSRTRATENAVEQLNLMGHKLGDHFKDFVANAKASLPFFKSASVPVSQGASETARSVQQAAGNPGVRGIIDAVTGTPPMSAVATRGAGAVGGTHLPGVGRTIERVSGED